MSEKNDKKYQQMMFTPISKLILTMSVPTIMAQMVSVIYNMVDTFYVAKLGTSVTAAVGVCNSLQSIIQAVGYGIGMGAGSLIARSLGQKNTEHANVIAITAQLMAVTFGFLLVLLCFPNISKFMNILGATDTMMDYAIAYGSVILLAAPILCLSFVNNCVVRYEGYLALSIIGSSIGCILNMLMDPIFIFTMNLGVKGAAISTVVAETVSCSIMLTILLSGKTTIQLKLSNIAKETKTYLQIIKSGLPTIFRQMMGSFSSALLNNAAKPFGDSTVAAITVANKLYMLIRNIVLGVGQALQPIAGYCYGANDRKRVIKAFNFATIYGTTFCLTAILVLTIWGTPIISLFQKDDPEIVRLGLQCMKYFCIVLPLLSFSTFANQLYQVLGFSKIASFLASLRQGICFAPIVIFLPKIIGIAGVQMAQAAADLLTFIITLPFMYFMYRHLTYQYEFTNK